MSTAHADPVITEFMASNTKTLAEDGAYSDWIEVYNPDSATVNLGGWFLTDSAKNKTKWTFPSVSVPPKGFIVVFASSKDRRTGTNLHTNFSLDADGEYLALIRPDGVAVTEFAPKYPAQQADISYGVTQFNSTGISEMGYLQSPTPGTANTASSAVTITSTVTFSRAPGPFASDFTLELSGAGADEHIRYVVATPSAAGATVPDPTADSPRYTGPLTLSSSVVIKAAVFSASKASHGATMVTQYVKIGGSTGPALQSFSSTLPILVLDDHGAGPLKKDSIDHDAWMYRYSPAGTGLPTFSNEPDLATPITMTVRGSSSASFPKKSYTIDLRDQTGAKSSAALVGTVSSRKWALVGPWYFDNTYIKNSFIYALANRMGHWAPHVQPVEVFFHQEGDLGSSSYAGIYLLTEKIEIDPQKVNITPTPSGTSPNADFTGGYLLKFDSPDPDEFGFSTAHDIPGGMAQVVVASAKAADLSVGQRNYLTTYFQDAEDTLIADAQGGFASRNYLDYFDRASWIDLHILNVFASNFDALERSFYISKDVGGKLVAGPAWDFDRSFGAATYSATVPPDEWYLPGAVNFWQTGWWGYFAHDPEFMQAWVDRWQALRQTTLSNTRLTTLADSLAAAIGPEAMARDQALWGPGMNLPEYAQGGTTGGVAQMKTWFNTRTAWIDQQFVAAPTVSDAGGTITFVAAAGAQLAYTLDGSDPRALGGKLAPNAVLSSTPLSVPSTTNVHVRAYRADREGVSPGTPWSSAVGGSASSPLSPAARLINISARALVGTGEDALIAGVTINDTVQKGYLVRGVGPTLASVGAANTLSDPTLGIYRADGVVIFRNTGWLNGNDSSSLAAVARSVGAFPLAAASVDSALLPQLAAGQYTVRISSATGQTGVALAELYETGGNGRTTNLSVRVNVQPGEGALFGGFVVQGPAYKRVLIRGIGPTLKTFGVNNALIDPILTVYSGQTIVATNDAWSSGNGAAAVAAAATSVGAFALKTGTEDAALLVTLAPGSYTVQVAGKNETSGVSLLEIYEVP
jgi:hypothetical protein